MWREFSRLNWLVKGTAAIAVVLALARLAMTLLQVEGPGGLETFQVILLAAAFLGALIELPGYRAGANEPTEDEVRFKNPRAIRFFAVGRGSAGFWLALRLYLGMMWFIAGWTKLLSPAWMNNGAALQGYWQAAINVRTQGANPSLAYPWYADFLSLLLNNGTQVWFAKLVIFGELAVGLGLLFGVLTGPAAFFGFVMNLSFLLAGSSGVNPLMLILAVGIWWAWRVAGHYGLDPWVLRQIGTPWQPGMMFHAPATPGSAKTPLAAN